MNLKRLAEIKLINSALWETDGKVTSNTHTMAITGTEFVKAYMNAVVDLPDCVKEIERLQPIEIALRNLYNDCRNEFCDVHRGRVMDEARKALEQE